MVVNGELVSADQYLDGDEKHYSSPKIQLHRPDVLREHMPQMIWVHPQGGSFDQDMIQAFFSDGSNPALSICIWCSKRGVNDMKAF